MHFLSERIALKNSDTNSRGLLLAVHLIFTQICNAMPFLSFIGILGEIFDYVDICQRWRAGKLVILILIFVSAGKLVV